MTKWLVRSGVVMLAVVMAFGVISSAAAQGPGGNDGPRVGGGRMAVAVRSFDTLVDMVVDATGLSRLDVMREVRNDKTLAEIATENGADPAAVVDAALAKVTETVNEAVANGRITQEQADTILAEEATFLPQAMEQTLGDLQVLENLRQRVQDRMELSLVDVIADALGVDVRDLLRDALTPPTLAEIAADNGLDPDTLIAEAETRITEQVNALVADGTITQAQADQVLDGLHDRLVDRFNQPIRLQQGQADRPGGMRNPRNGGNGGNGGGQSDNGNGAGGGI